MDFHALTAPNIVNYSLFFNNLLSVQQALISDAAQFLAKENASATEINQICFSKSEIKVTDFFKV